MSSISDALAQAIAQIKPKVDAALADEVANAVKKNEAESIEQQVYGVYKPKDYPRRGTKGGLGSKENMVAIVAGGVLTVTNETPPASGDGYTTDKQLDILVEYGDGYSGNFYDFGSNGGGRYLFARPFTLHTIESLRGNKDHVEALRAGLKQRGLNVK